MPTAAHLELVPTPVAADPPSDEALFLAAADGDERAFDALVVRNEVPVRRFCRAIVHDTCTADEVAQDVFLSLWRARRRYRAEGKFRQFLFTIARNRCRSIARRRAVLSFVGLDDRDCELVDDSPSAEHVLELADTTQLVRSAVLRLPLKFRVPILLRFGEEMPYEEIAAIIGRTPSGARSRVHHGLKALAKHLPKEVAPWNA